MKIELKVELLDTGSAFELEVRSPDFRAWERKTGKSWLEETTSLTMISEVAYYAAMRTRQYLGTEEEWDLVADVDEIDAEADPTQQEAGESSSSA